MRFSRLFLAFMLLGAALVLVTLSAKPGTGSASAVNTASAAVAANAFDPCCVGDSGEGAPAKNICGSVACVSHACVVMDRHVYVPVLAGLWNLPVTESGRSLALAPDPRPPRIVVLIG